jgi:pimeloyl-ACP methyl ester carboxylesterase
MPPSWGAGALLHPGKRPVTEAVPVGAEAVELPSVTPGIMLKGWWFKTPSPRRGAVIYLHGSADNRTSVKSVAQRLVPMGFDVLAYDSRAHGESGGDACTYGYYEKWDVRKAIDLLGTDQVVLVGASLGAAVALQAAPEDSRIRAVVAISTFSDLASVARFRAPWFASEGNIQAAFRIAEAQAKFVVDDTSPVKAAARIQVPVILIHGDQDPETPMSHSEKVHAALVAEKRLLIVKGGHCPTFDKNTWAVVDALLNRIQY